MLVCLPLTPATLRELADRGLADITAVGPTPALARACGHDATMAEDTDYVALLLASVASLRLGPRRCVAVAEVGRVVDEGDPGGVVCCPRVEWVDVTGLFVDEPEVAALVADAGEQARAATDLDAAWDTAGVQALLEQADLLWYSPEELDAVLTLLEG